MNLESDLADALYQKLGGLTMEEIRSADGKVLLGCGRIRKYSILRAIRAGQVQALIDLLVPDPALPHSYGTKRIRDGLSSLAKTTQVSGADLGKSISDILRKK